jgi:hypothetical protein
MIVSIELWALIAMIVVSFGAGWLIRSTGPQR